MILRFIGHLIWLTVCLFLGIAIGMFMFKATARGDNSNSTVVTIVRESAKHNIDPKLVAAIIKVESNWNVNAKGSVGEVGLMQMHPRFHKDTSIRAGIEYLAFVRKHCPYKENLTWVSCYNQGLTKHPKHPELLPYYKKVMSEYEALGGTKQSR